MDIMAIGVIVNCLAVFAGGILGSVMKQAIPKEIKDGLPVVLGVSSIVLGIYNLRNIDNITVVVLSIILGYICGELLNLDLRIVTLSELINKSALKNQGRDILTLAVVIFCFSGTGIYGAVAEGIYSDSSVLLSKAVLDFFTACIFAALIGIVISWISVLQFVVLYLIFLISSLLAPYFTPDVIGNFIAVGGALSIFIGLNMSDILKIKVANIIPALMVSLVLSFCF